MSLQPKPIEPVPDETARVARAAFPKGTAFMRMHDELGTIYDDPLFAQLYPARGQPAEPPWRLALTMVMQYVEGLSDRQTADAVRGRIDWKYALGLELTDAGFDYSVLSEFRDRLIAGGLERSILDVMLVKFRELGLLRARGRQRTDSTHVLAAIRPLNRLENVGETLRAALNDLAVAAPEWLTDQIDHQWFDRYGSRIEHRRLPKERREREEYGAQVGVDGYRLLDAIDSDSGPEWLKEVPAIKTLAQVWEQQYERLGGQVRWRTVSELPPAGERIDSPYDPEAHEGYKRSTLWTGYKVHVTEGCDHEDVHLITNVETRNATEVEVAGAPIVHESLAAKDLLPDQHIVDAGYVDGEVLASSERDYGVRIIGPARMDTSWQYASGEGFDVANFGIDWESKQVRCPEGRVSTRWIPATTPYGEEIAVIHFDRADCLDCPARAKCTRSKSGARSLTLRQRESHEATQAARAAQKTADWKQEYKARSGIEGTLSQGVRKFGLRRSRYIGKAKTHLQHILTAAAINLTRMDAWLTSIPQASTRTSNFLALSKHAT